MENFQNRMIAEIIGRFKSYQVLGEKAMEQLNDSDMHLQANASCNSIAMTIQHMSGNMLSRWTNFLTEDGEKPWRHRDSEFEHSALPKTVLLQKWKAGWDCLYDALQSLQPADLDRTICIRHESLAVSDAIFRQLAHYPYHVGQIIFMAKMIRSKAWKSLSIPVGASDAFNEKMKDDFDGSAGQRH